MNTQMAEELRMGVWHAYSNVALQPKAKHPFPTGRKLAINVGYPKTALANLPITTVESFAGVSYLPGFVDFQARSTVLDLGCGAGLDTLLAAQQVGPNGTIISIDFSETMLGRAYQAAQEKQFGNVHFICGAAEALPLPTASVDVAMVNGIFNLNPARDAIFAELARMIRPGGTVYAAELVLRSAQAQAVQANKDNWFA